MAAAKVIQHFNPQDSASELANAIFVTSLIFQVLLLEKTMLLPAKMVCSHMPWNF